MTYKVPQTLAPKALAVAALSALVAVPVAAQERDWEDTEIVVQSPRAAFAEAVGEELNDALYAVAYPGDFSGVVRIAFDARPDGSAANARVVESSGSRWVDRSAMRAVARMDDMGPTPTGDHAGQPVLATIVYATDERQMRRLTRHLDAGLDTLMASGTVDANVLALTLLPDDRH